MRVKRETKKAGLKLNIQKSKIIASGQTTSWEIEGEKVETETDFIFLGSKITAEGNCSHEIKRYFLLGRKVMTNPDSAWSMDKSLWHCTGVSDQDDTPKKKFKKAKWFSEETLQRAEKRREPKAKEKRKDSVQLCAFSVIPGH